MGPKFETVPAAGPTPPPGGWDPGVTPNTTGLPGIPQAQALAGGIITYVLIGLVVAMIISALVWAFSAWKGIRAVCRAGNEPDRLLRCGDHRRRG